MSIGVLVICLNCRLSTHKKCHTKVNGTCTKAVLSTAMITGRRFFGAELAFLTGDELVVPPVLNNMLLTLELKALFVEGLYRKTGSLAIVVSTGHRIYKRLKLLA